MRNALKSNYILLLSVMVAITGFCLLSSCKQREVKTTETVQKDPASESDAFKRGKRQLQIQGYENIQEKAYPLFCCSKADSFFYSTGFIAEKDGERVEGCICTGLFRNSITIRFE